MTTQHIKSYLEIAKSEGKEKAIELFDQDSNFISLHHPQIDRHITHICEEIGKLHEDINFLGTSLNRLHEVLKIIEQLTNLKKDISNDIRH